MFAARFLATRMATRPGGRGEQIGLGDRRTTSNHSQMAVVVKEMTGGLLLPPPELERREVAADLAPAGE